jgi:phage host-nuclease inhibitor protein Gam
MKAPHRAVKGARIPRSLADAREAVRRIGAALAAGRRVARTYDARIEKLRARISALEKERDVTAGPHEEEARAIANALHRFAESHREELTREAKKVKLGKGAFFTWRLPGKPALIVDEHRFYDEVEKAGLADRFVRVIKEPNKQAMHDDLAAAECLKSVSLERLERFTVQPAGSSLRIERKLGTEHAEWEVKELES